MRRSFDRVLRRLRQWLGWALRAILPAGPVLRWAVVRGGSRATGTAVTLADAALTRGDGAVVLTGLRVPNPPGFSDSAFLTLDHVRLAVSPNSLFSDVLRVQAVRLDGLHLALEQSGRRLNALTLRQRMGAIDTPAAGQGGPRRVLIESLTLNDAIVTVTAGPAGARLAVDVHLDHVVLRGIETRTDGTAILAEMVGVILELVLVSLASRVAEALPAPVSRVVAGALAELGAPGGLRYERVSGGNITVTDVRGEGVFKSAGQSRARAHPGRF